MMGSQDMRSVTTSSSSSKHAPTFFVGTYHPSAKAGSRKPKFQIRLDPLWKCFYNALLVVLDAVVMAASAGLVMLIATNIRNTVTVKMPGGVPGILLMLCLVWVFSLFVCKAYTRHVMGEGYELYARILSSGVFCFFAMCSISYLFDIDYPRWLVGLSAFIAGMLTIVERWLMRRWLHANRRQGTFNYPTVIIGSPQGIHDTIDKLMSTSGCAVGYKPIAVCPVEQEERELDSDSPQYLVPVPFHAQNEFEQGLRVLALNSHLPYTARNLGARTVLVTDVLTRDSETLRTLSLAVESLNMELAVAASVADIGGGRVELKGNSTMPILTASLPQYSWSTRLMKRAMDIFGSLVALIPGSIIMLIVAILIKKEDGGPVFYKQERIGRYGEPFQVLKLRSMRVDADKHDREIAQAAGVELGVAFKAKDDPRITKVGSFIRKTSIDEIPQFINVLKGDMSLVGPRPQRQYEVDQYSTLYSARLLVRPGITGPWQISGRNNLSQEDTEYLDVNYVENWSLMTDVAILLKTVGVVFTGDGAY